MEDRQGCQQSSVTNTQNQTPTPGDPCTSKPGRAAADAADAPHGRTRTQRADKTDMT